MRMGANSPIPGPDGLFIGDPPDGLADQLTVVGIDVGEVVVAEFQIDDARLAVIVAPGNRGAA